MKNRGTKTTTNMLLGRLFQASSFDKFKIDNAAELGLPRLDEYLNRLCDERGEVTEHVIERSGIDRVYGHQIFGGRRQPTRDKVLQLAFGFRMSIEEVQRLLTIARKSALYPRVERDAVILFCLEKQAPLQKAQEMLMDLGLPILGGEKSRD